MVCYLAFKCTPVNVTCFGLSEGDLVFGEAKCTVGPPFFLHFYLGVHVNVSVCVSASSPVTSLSIGNTAL